MNNNDKNKALIFLKRTIILYVLESIIMEILFIINGQVDSAKFIGIVTGILFLVIYFSTRIVIAKNHGSYRYFPIYIISIMIILLITFLSLFETRFFKVGDMKFAYPKEAGYVYGFKDKNNKYYYTTYYFDYCSIEIQKTHNNKTYSIFKNIKNHVKPEDKITETITKGDIYKSKFIEGTANINGKKWTTKYTEVDTIKYTIYYRVSGNDIYIISVANYNTNPKKCANKVKETFNTIKYSN